MAKISAFIDNPRASAIKCLRESIPESQWAANTKYLAKLRDMVRRHRLIRHPIIELLESGEVSAESIRAIHLDYRCAIVQIFTDALTAATLECRQLEPRLKSGAKMYPRFLLGLNCLDEFGFRPGLGPHGYQGSPRLAHYVLFEQLLDVMGITDSDRAGCAPSEQARALKQYLEGSYSDYSMILALLAVAEIQVIVFSPPLRAATAALGYDVSSGYYHVHGTKDDSGCEAADDDHEEDLWLALAQACTSDQYSALASAAEAYLNLWEAFWDQQMQRTEAMVDFIQVRPVDRNYRASKEPHP